MLLIPFFLYKFVISIMPHHDSKTKIKAELQHLKHPLKPDKLDISSPQINI